MPDLRTRSQINRHKARLPRLREAVLRWLPLAAALVEIMLHLLTTTALADPPSDLHPLMDTINHF